MSGFRWDAADYAGHSCVQQRWAEELAARLTLRGDESILDIGSGDGKVTASLAERVPAGRVHGIDSSDEMVELAKRLFPACRYANLSFERRDARHLAFDREFDVVFSNATLHWVRDHRPVLQGIRNALAAGGRTLLQMGGAGNASDVVDVFSELTKSARWRDCFLDFVFPYGFHGPDEYREWLSDSGLVSQRVELIPKDMVHVERAAFHGWIRTTWIPYTQRVAQQRRAEFVEEFVDRYLELFPPDSAGNVHVAMVRLEVEAVRE